MPCPTRGGSNDSARGTRQQDRGGELGGAGGRGETAGRAHDQRPAPETILEGVQIATDYWAQIRVQHCGSDPLVLPKLGVDERGSADRSGRVPGFDGLGDGDLGGAVLMGIEQPDRD